MSAEQYRSLVEKYFKPEDVAKALYVIDHESGGNAAAVGDNGASHGLFQLNDHGLGSGMSVGDRLDPEKNIETAARAVYGGSGWKPWGEGNTFHGATFGSLGNNPYPGTQPVNGRASTTDGITFGGTQAPADSTPNPAAPSGERAAIQAANAALNALLGQQPDFATNPEAYQAWKDRVAGLQNYVDGLTRQAGLRDTTFANNQTQFADQTGLDTAAQNNAQNQITNFLNGAQESRGRATLNLDAQKLLQQYGVPEGKTSISYNELGGPGAAWSKLLGVAPESSAFGWQGTTRIDPGADLAAGDAKFGAGGNIPQLPGLPDRSGSIPQLPQSPEWPAPPNTYKLPGINDTFPHSAASAPPASGSGTGSQIKDAAGKLFSIAW